MNKIIEIRIRNVSDLGLAGQQHISKQDKPKDYCGYAKVIYSQNEDGKAYISDVIAIGNPLKEFYSHIPIF